MRTPIQVLAGVATLADAVVHRIDMFRTIVLRPAITPAATSPVITAIATMQVSRHSLVAT